MNCPISDCDFEFTDNEASEPYITHKILLHIIESHTLMQQGKTHLQKLELDGSFKIVSYL